MEDSEMQNHLQSSSSGQLPQKAGSNKILIGILITIGSIFAIVFMIGGAMVTDKLLAKIIRNYQAESNFLENYEMEDEYIDWQDENLEEELENELYGITPDCTYYSELTTVIDKTVGYLFYEQNLSHEDSKNGVGIYLSYFFLEGENLPNLEKLNEEIEVVSTRLLQDYDKFSKEAENSNKNYFEASSAQYVTYNDKEKASIVISEYLAEEEFLIRLNCINLDLVNGTIIDNTNMLEFDESFVPEFRERCKEQNDNGLEGVSDEKIYEYLQNPENLIVFFTPLGMEIGINYEDGWITVTYKDYEKYLK